MSSGLEKELQRFFENMKENASLDFLASDTGKFCSVQRGELIKEVLDMVPKENRRIMENNIDELFAADIPYEEYIYARGVSDGIKILLKLIN